VQRLARGQELPGAAPDRGQIAQVKRQQLKLAVPGLARDLLDRPASALGRTASEMEARAAGRQRPRRLLADSGVGAGDQERSAV